MVHTRKCFLAAAGITSTAAVGFTNGAESTKYAAIAVIADKDDAIETVIGEISKHPRNPILVQDQPWEARLDNGYPNVVHNPSDPLGKWRMWYGDCIDSCDNQLLLYANSSDGVSWEKPELGIYDLGNVKPEWESIGTRNNVVMQGGGVGVYRDDHEANASRRFKAVGGGKAGAAACFGPTGSENCISGTATSPDGLHWYEPMNVSWPRPQRYDCHNNLFWDELQGAYLVTTRDILSADERCIGITTSELGQFAFDTSEAPSVVEQGSRDAQLYSQITFPFYNAYLGIVMVYDATSADGKVHCRLSWSPDSLEWHWVDVGGLKGRDFIPLGPPPDTKPCSEWEPVTEKGHELTDCEAYREGARPSPAHNTSKRPESVIQDRPLAACREACSQDPYCETIQWRGKARYDYDETSDGQCHLFQSCHSAKACDTKPAPTFCMQTERCVRPSVFDSHICFAAASPVPVPGEGARVYYMGGNGPHYGTRDSAMGIAMVRADGFAGLRGNGVITTKPLKVTGATMIITADIEGSIVVAVNWGAPSLPITGNVTDAEVDLDFAMLVGEDVVIGLGLNDATLYTIGFLNEQHDILA